MYTQIRVDDLFHFGRRQSKDKIIDKELMIAITAEGVFSGEILVVELSLNKKKPTLVSLDPAIDFNEKSILLIDDVANSGRTMLYALKPLLETYPKKIQTLVMVERTHKSFPIDVDYVGLSISTSLDQHITLEVDGDEVGGAWLQ